MIASSDEKNKLKICPLKSNDMMSMDTNQLIDETKSQIDVQEIGKLEVQFSTENELSMDEI